MDKSAHSAALNYANMNEGSLGRVGVLMPVDFCRYFVKSFYNTNVCAALAMFLALCKRTCYGCYGAVDT